MEVSVCLREAETCRMMKILVVAFFSFDAV